MLARLELPRWPVIVVEKLDGVDVLVMEYVPGEAAARLVWRYACRAGGRVEWRTVGWTLDVLDAPATRTAGGGSPGHQAGQRDGARRPRPGGQGADMGLAKCPVRRGPAEEELTTSTVRCSGPASTCRRGSGRAARCGRRRPTCTPWGGNAV